MKNQFQKNKNKFDSFIRYSSLAFEMMGIIALGTFLGFKIDQWMENEFKGFTLGLMILSVIGSVFYSIRNLLKK
ncbi:MAG: AtpZ/AtpI family protein [Mariniphaga sp.]|nr:AtpZ/AtpI family protein [Mariniphaga sp.]